MGKRTSVRCGASHHSTERIGWLGAKQPNFTMQAAPARRARRHRRGNDHLHAERNHPPRISERWTSPRRKELTVTLRANDLAATDSRYRIRTQAATRATSATRASTKAGLDRARIPVAHLARSVAEEAGLVFAGAELPAARAMQVRVSGDAWRSGEAGGIPRARRHESSACARAGKPALRGCCD